jgi:hypothetical protein
VRGRVREMEKGTAMRSAEIPLFERRQEQEAGAGAHRRQ